MIGWYIGEALTLLLVVPVVVLLLARLLKSVKDINAYVDDVLEHGVLLTGTIDAVPKLVETKRLTAVAVEGVGRYGAALERLL
ncbi:MAG: hypothetical protein M3063_11235 [Actinomycetota bacterium]|nr:hypothetical protein [Actinomycetota bacterium]